jgi:hypothetical protein
MKTGNNFVTVVKIRPDDTVAVKDDNETKEGVELVDMCSEDVAFCKNIEDAGFDIMLNTRLRVGHEKSVIL